MSKSNNYKAGQKDGRAGFGPQSSDQEYRHGYRVGQQEYDYWNDKNLYPDLRNDDGIEQSRAGQSADLDDARVGLGSVFVAMFGWMVVFAPFALFFTWQDWVVQVVFWGGAAVIVLVFLLWLYGAIEEERGKKGK